MSICHDVWSCHFTASIRYESFHFKRQNWLFKYYFHWGHFLFFAHLTQIFDVDRLFALSLSRFLYLLLLFSWLLICFVLLYYKFISIIHCNLKHNACHFHKQSGEWPEWFSEKYRFSWGMFCVNRTTFLAVSIQAISNFLLPLLLFSSRKIWNKIINTKPSSSYNLIKTWMKQSFKFKRYMVSVECIYSVKQQQQNPHHATLC